MGISQIAKTLEKFTIDNSPLLLTGAAVAGTITTALLTGRASYKAAELLQEETDVLIEKYGSAQRVIDSGDWFNTKEKFKLVWPLYIPAVANAAMTVTCIIVSHKIGSRRAAAMAAAYTISEKAFEEYREKIVEKLGANKERAARDEIAVARMEQNPIDNNQIFPIGNGDVPCYDQYSGRYFTSSMEDIKKAMNDTNYQINSQGYASLNDFYNQLGLPNIPIGEEVGWRDRLMDIHFTFTATDDQKPAHSIQFYVEPVRNYFRAH